MRRLTHPKLFPALAILLLANSIDATTTVSDSGKRCFSTIKNLRDEKPSNPYIQRLIQLLENPHFEGKVKVGLFMKYDAFLDVKFDDDHITATISVPQANFLIPNMPAVVCELDGHYLLENTTSKEEYPFETDGNQVTLTADGHDVSLQPAARRQVASDAGGYNK